MNKAPFRSPSKKWLVFIIPLSIISILLCLNYSIELVFREETSLTKPLLLVGVFTLFSSTYLFTGYRYLLWSNPYKNELYDLQKKLPVVVYKDGYYHINEDLLIKMNLDPKPYKIIQRRELKYIYHLDNTNKRGEYNESNQL
ncbi:hypothetical protein J2S74_002839 [Evansella vedderi]|uniref:Photosystem I assembly protein Ycf4 n=1 Tax=Evansella vedderi TaxID=38282 RepID=A0ABT9ZW48_9BACI|nr:hypothetical protein [Evansella vedderi]MDQ0255457.1 hypothetical protein [Evansella vedderi]